MKRSDWWSTLAGTLFGAAIGVGFFTFIYAQGGSYLGHDPAACANCHVMNQQFDGWVKSSHRAVAGCNDCHTPHGNLVAKYAVKALNGFRHSWAFTSGDFHEPIAITPLNRSVTESACRHCHEDVAHSMIALDRGDGGDPNDISCLRCHGSVGHAELSPVASRPER